MDGAAYRKSRIVGTVVVVAALIVVFLLGSWTLFLVVPLLAILLALHLRCPDPNYKGPRDYREIGGPPPNAGV